MNELFSIDEMAWSVDFVGDILSPVDVKQPDKLIRHHSKGGRYSVLRPVIGWLWS